MGNEDGERNNSCWIQFLTSYMSATTMPLNAQMLVIVVVECRAPDHRYPLSAATHIASL